MKVTVVIPVFNEHHRLRRSIRLLDQWLGKSYEIVIADNGSTDRTWKLANQLAEEYANIRAVHLEEKGRGRALTKVWLESESDILSYMDVDLSTDLAAFPKLIEPLARGEFDLAIGSRLVEGSETRRGLKREVISRGYNRLVEMCFHTKFSDAQCGFKAITR